MSKISITTIYQTTKSNVISTSIFHSPKKNLAKLQLTRSTFPQPEEALISLPTPSYPSSSNAIPQCAAAVMVSLPVVIAVGDPMDVLNPSPFPGIHLVSKSLYPILFTHALYEYSLSSATTQMAWLG